MVLAPSFGNRTRVTQPKERCEHRRLGFNDGLSPTAVSTIIVAATVDTQGSASHVLTSEPAANHFDNGGSRLHGVLHLKRPPMQPLANCIVKDHLAGWGPFPLSP